MKKNKAFILIELLVAATIIGALVVFATISYRKSAAEARWTAAKARVDVLGTAVKRFKMDYKSVSFSGDGILQDVEMGSLGWGGYQCTLKPWSGNVPAQILIGCGYVEDGGWDDSTWTYSVSPTKCKGGYACVYATSNARMPSEYKNKIYYVDDAGGHDGTLN